MNGVYYEWDKKMSDWNLIIWDFDAEGVLLLI